MSSEPSASSIFPRTDWAGLGQAAEADEARLDGLIRLYWAPLRIFLVATFPSLKDQAEVLLQEFAEDKILKEGWLRRADRNRGRFRDFLKTSLRHFVLDRLNRAEARRPPVSLEELGRELPGPAGPSDEFDLTWIRAVLAETLRRMEADCRDPAADQPRRGFIWEMFRIRLIDPVLNDAPQDPLRGINRAVRDQVSHGRVQPAVERQTDFQDAPGQSHQGICGTGCRNRRGNPGAGAFCLASGQAVLTCKIHKRSSYGDGTVCLSLTPPRH